MKINEVMVEAQYVEAQYVRGPEGRALAAADKHAKVKANREKAAAFTAQKNAPSAEEPAATPPAATAPAAKPNYGAGGAGIPNIQVTPTQKTPAAKPVTQASPTPVPGAGMPTPPGAGMPKPVAKPAGTPTDDTNKDSQGQKADGDWTNAAANPWTRGIAKGLGATDTVAAIDAGERSNIGQGGKETADADTDKTKQGEPVAEPNTAKPGEPVTLANPISQPGAETPDKETTLANPISAKPGEEKPAAAAPAAAKGKTMTKQEILAWISRNDEDNAALQSFKDGITAAEKTGAGAAAPDDMADISDAEIAKSTAAADDERLSRAAGRTDLNPRVKASVDAEIAKRASNKKPAAGVKYGDPNPGIQNIQVAPNTVTNTPKTTSTTTTTKNFGTPKVPVKQKELASKQYKKAPL
jgi:hypothetical protein